MIQRRYQYESLLTSDSPRDGLDVAIPMTTCVFCSHRVPSPRLAFSTLQSKNAPASVGRPQRRLRNVSGYLSFLDSLLSVLAVIVVYSLVSAHDAVLSDVESLYLAL